MMAFRRFLSWLAVEPLAIPFTPSHNDGRGERSGEQGGMKDGDGQFATH
jgi:hypothetical protein